MGRKLSLAVFGNDNSLSVRIDDRGGLLNWKERLSFHLKLHHPDLTVDDIEPTDTPGHWKIKGTFEEKEARRCPLHDCFFYEGSWPHTIQFRDPIQVKGRFSSSYLTWRAHWQELENNASLEVK